MPNKLTRYTAWERLQFRFRLEPIGAIIGKSIADEVVPITNMDTTLLTPTLRADALDLTGTLGALVVAQTVPAGERWRLQWFSRAPTSTNSALFCTIGGVSGQITVLSTSALAVNIPITLLEGDVYGMRATADAGDGSIDLIVAFEIEEV